MEEKIKISNEDSVKKITNSVKDATEIQILNSASDIRSSLGLGSVAGTQVSQSDTMFKNLRWHLISNMRSLISQAYVEIGLISTIVDVPVEDALRGDIDITTSMLDEDEIKKLKRALIDDGDKEALSDALKWKRLYGGGAVIAVTDQDPSTPLDMENINEGSMLKFKDVDMWQLYNAENLKDDSDIRVFDENTVRNDEFYYIDGVKVHPSRVIPLKGGKAPSLVRPQLRGWGLSVIEKMVRSINQYLKGVNLTFEILDEYKIDVYKMKGLAAAMGIKGGDKAIRDRVQIANEQKNFQDALTLDAEDEYIQKQYSFAGISETFTGMKVQVASDMRMPLTKIFGVSSAGFNSGEDDIENYNAMVESSIREQAGRAYAKMVKMKARKMFGITLEDLEIEFEPLRVLSSEQEQNVKNHKFNRLIQARQAGLISQETFVDVCNRENLLGVQLDESEAELEPVTPTKEGSDSSSGASSSSMSAPDAPTVKNSLEDDPHNFKGRKVSVVGVMSGDEILTGKRKDTEKWTCPGGHLDDGENPKTGAVREVYEESGVRLLESDLDEVYSGIIEDHEGNKIALFAYIAQIPKQDTRTDLDPDDEVYSWKWVKLSSGSKELKPDNRHAGSNDVIIKHLVEKEMLSSRKILPYLFG